MLEWLRVAPSGRSHLQRVAPYESSKQFLGSALKLTLHELKFLKRDSGSEVLALGWPFAAREFYGGRGLQRVALNDYGRVLE